MANKSLDAVISKALGTTPKAQAKQKQQEVKNANVREIRIRRGHQGGYISGHEMETANGERMYDHTREFPIPSMNDLLDHIKKHMPEEAAEIAADKGKK